MPVYGIFQDGGTIFGGTLIACILGAIVLGAIVLLVLYGKVRGSGSSGK